MGDLLNRDTANQLAVSAILFLCDLFHIRPTYVRNMMKNVHCENNVEGNMQVPNDGKTTFAQRSSVRPLVIAGGISSIVLLLATLAVANGQPASQEPASTNVSDAAASSGAKIKVDDPDPSVLPDDQVSETFSRSADGTSETRQYRSSSTDDNGNQTTQEHTYTTNTDGTSAVGIDISSNSTTTGSASSSSSSSINISSSSRQSISTQN